MESQPPIGAQTSSPSVVIAGAQEADTSFSVASHGCFARQSYVAARSGCSVFARTVHVDDEAKSWAPHDVSSARYRLHAASSSGFAVAGSVALKPELAHSRSSDLLQVVPSWPQLSSHSVLGLQP